MREGLTVTLDLKDGHLFPADFGCEPMGRRFGSLVRNTPAPGSRGKGYARNARKNPVSLREELQCHPMRR